jgi:cytochrome c-type biogenesis protein
MSFSIPAIFLAGVLTFASPCVLPLIPIYLATLAGGSLDQARPRRTLLVACAFALGLGVVFVALGALASSLGELLARHRIAITLASGGLMLAFGARALGFLRLTTLERDLRPGLMRARDASSIAGAFVFGAAFALGWSPCIGPVLAAVLAYAATHADSPLRGAFYLGVYAAGIAVPLLLCALGATRVAAWMKRIRSAIPKLEKLTGAALVAVGVWTLAAAVLELRAADESIALATVRSDAAADGGGNTTCAVDGVPGHTCALRSGLSNAAPTEDSLHARVDGAKFLEFTSDDCPICRRMQPVIEKLAASCSELDAGLVRVDVATSSGRALAEHHHVRGTPTFVLLDEQGVERARLLGENSREALAAAVEKAFGVSCWS